MPAEPPSGIVAAVPRSRLHIQFLLDNDAQPDLVLYRDEALGPELERFFPGKTLFLGRETRPGRTLAGLLTARRENRAYYAGVAERLANLSIGRLILFLEGEPLERFLLTLPQVGNVELWEDGLSHYVDLTHPLWYAARGAVQWVSGFHADGILSRRIHRRGIIVRDRFERRNLVLHPLVKPAEQRNELLLIGSPLVEDGLLGRNRFKRGLAKIAVASPLPVRYLPHPREDAIRLKSDVQGLGGIAIAANDEGLMAHAGRFDYTVYAAAVSTGLLDLGRYERSIFIPDLFGLHRMGRVLAGWNDNPVAVAKSLPDLSRHLFRMSVARSRAAHAAPST